MRALVWIIVIAALSVLLLAGLALAEPPSGYEYDVQSPPPLTLNSACKIVYEDAIPLRDGIMQGHLKVTQEIRMYICFRNGVYWLTAQRRYLEELDGKDVPIQASGRMKDGWVDVAEETLPRGMSDDGKTLVAPSWRTEGLFTP